MFSYHVLLEADAGTKIEDVTCRAVMARRNIDGYKKVYLMFNNVLIEVADKTCVELTNEYYSRIEAKPSPCDVLFSLLENNGFVRHKEEANIIKAKQDYVRDFLIKHADAITGRKDAL